MLSSDIYFRPAFGNVFLAQNMTVVSKKFINIDSEEMCKALHIISIANQICVNALRGDYVGVAYAEHFKSIRCICLIMYKVLLVGLGNIGMKYDFDDFTEDKILTHAKAFDVHQSFEICGAVDVDENAITKFKTRYSGKVFKRLEDALDCLNPDVIVISVPTEEQLSCIEIIAKNSAPAIILCEKPMSVNFVKAERVINKLESTGIKIFINYMRNVEPGVLEFKNLVNNGLKTPVNGVVWYTKGMYNSASHFVSLLQTLLGEVIGSERISPKQENNNNDPELDFSISFTNGVVRFLALDSLGYSHASLELISNNGRFTYDYGGEVIGWNGLVESNVYPGYTYLEKRKIDLDTDFFRMQFHVVQQIYKQLVEGNCDLSTGRSALSVIKILGKIETDK